MNPYIIEPRETYTFETYGAFLQGWEPYLDQHSELNIPIGCSLDMEDGDQPRLLRLVILMPRNGILQGIHIRNWTPDDHAAAKKLVVTSLRRLADAHEAKP